MAGKIALEKTSSVGDKILASMLALFLVRVRGTVSGSPG